MPVAQPLHDVDPRDLEIARAVEGFTGTGLERVLALIGAVRHVHRYGIPGALVECGVWRGGSSMAMARTLIDEGCADRELFLFDTFEGMTPPGEFDRNPSGIPAAELLAREPDYYAAAASLDEVSGNLLSTGYPSEKLRFIKGPVESTLPAAAPARIALLRLDTDWYESTRHELEHLFPRLAIGGVLIIDDYGDWQGARKAVDEFIAAHPQEPILMHPIDRTGRMIVRVGPRTTG
jgi:hypothetical protein